MLGCSIFGSCKRGVNDDNIHMHKFPSKYLISRLRNIATCRTDIFDQKLFSCVAGISRRKTTKEYIPIPTSQIRLLGDAVAPLCLPQYNDTFRF